MLKTHPLFFATFLFPALVQGDYIIDDSETSVLNFSGNPSGAAWSQFGSDTGDVLELLLPNQTVQNVDAAPCYDGTFTYAACTTSNNCQMQFSFIGSGITIYVLQAGSEGMSVSLSIDSGTATTATLAAPSPPQYYASHVTLFNEQNMVSGTHTAVMTLLDWDASFSTIMVDYIDVNSTLITPESPPLPATTTSEGSSSSSTTSSSSTQSSSSTSTANSQTGSQQTSLTGTQTSSLASSASGTSVFSSQASGATALPSQTSSDSKTKVAAIAGGTVGGTVSLIALPLLACCYRRRRRQRLQARNERPSPLLLPQPETRHANVDPAIADPFAALPTNGGSGTVHESNSRSGFIPSSTVRDPRSSRPVVDRSQTGVASSSNFSAAPSVPVSVSVGAVAATPPDRDAPSSTQPAPANSPTALPVGCTDEKLRRASGTPTQSTQQDTVTTQGATGTRPNTVLTDDQADFVNSLFSNNVPAPVVARVLERMLTNPQGANNVGVNDPELTDLGSLRPSSQTQTTVGGDSWLPTMSDVGDGETLAGTAPPSYDFVRASTRS